MRRRSSQGPDSSHRTEAITGLAPKELENDEYIRIARRLLYLDVAPAIGKLLDCYKSLAVEFGLNVAFFD